MAVNEDCTVIESKIVPLGAQNTLETRNMGHTLKATTFSVSYFRHLEGIN